MDIIHDTILQNYPDLNDLFDQISQINWDRMFVNNNVSKKKKQKTEVNTYKLTDDDKEFLSLQKAFVLLGMFVNRDGYRYNHIMKINVEPKDYDELITNIRWVSYDKGISLLNKLSSLCQRIFLHLYKDVYSIRSATTQLLCDLIIERLSVLQTSDDSLFSDFLLNNDLIWDVAKMLEESLMLYTILLSSDTCDGNLNGLCWDNDLVRNIYWVKCNTIVSSLGNFAFSSDLLKTILLNNGFPLIVSFMKRSQLLGGRFEQIEIDRLKIFEESGIMSEDEDYTKILSSVKCKVCKLYHTSYTQAQTRSADEPMTIFYYCHKCKIRNRQ